MIALIKSWKTLDIAGEQQSLSSLGMAVVQNVVPVARSVQNEDVNFGDGLMNAHKVFRDLQGMEGPFHMCSECERLYKGVTEVAVEDLEGEE